MDLKKTECLYLKTYIDYSLFDNLLSTTNELLLNSLSHFRLVDEG